MFFSFSFFKHFRVQQTNINDQVGGLGPPNQIFAIQFTRIARIHDKTKISQVEDTKLEANAEDTKKPRPKPRTALPRTDPLEAKDRNAECQGQRRKCFPKRFLKHFSGEKGLQKFFSGDSQLRKTRKGLRKFSARFMAFSSKIPTVRKIVQYSSRFSRTWGFEPKDFKMCPRRRPRGLDLC